MTANVETFAAIYQRALDRKGGEAQLHALLGATKSRAELLSYSDADWLDALTKKIFQSGFVWRVVENKWPGFREVFFDFVPEKMVLMSDEMLAAKEPPGAQDANRLVAQARALLVPSETGRGFRKQYFDALQRDPAVVLAHGATVKLLARLA